MTHPHTSLLRTAPRGGWRVATLAAALVVVALAAAGPGAALGPQATAHEPAAAPAPPQGAPATAQAPAAHGEHVQPAGAGEPVPAAADPGASPGHATAGPDATDAHGAAEHGEAAGHGESPWATASRVVNFVLLAGGLIYLLRSPLGSYLSARAEQIRSDLVNAAQTRTAAAAELKNIEARLKALPAEIEALQARGKAEVEAEHGRIGAAAAAERERMMEQTRRDIQLQLQAARRALRHEAADLAVSVARTRIAHEITDADRLRLVDRYVSQVKTAHD